MSIDDYIVRLESIIASSPVVSSYDITIDRKTNDIAFVSGVIELRDDTTIYKIFFVLIVVIYLVRISIISIIPKWILAILSRISLLINASLATIFSVLYEI